MFHNRFCDEKSPAKKYLKKGSIMGQGSSNANLRKRKHLNKTEMELIPTLYNQGKSISEIARVLCGSYNTIKNELKRGHNLNYDGKSDAFPDDYISKV